MTTKNETLAELLTSLPQEQFDKLTPLTEEQLRTALEQGRAARDAMKADIHHPRIDPGTRFR